MVDVDAALVRLARERGASLITVDHNLAQVAEALRVPVAQINALASSFRMPYTAGDEISVRLVKEGREHGQAVGYLDDGTMVVVEDAAELIGVAGRRPGPQRDPDDHRPDDLRGPSRRPAAEPRGDLGRPAAARVCHAARMEPDDARPRRSCSPRARAAGSAPRHRRRSCRSASARCSRWPPPRPPRPPRSGPSSSPRRRVRGTRRSAASRACPFPRLVVTGGRDAAGVGASGARRRPGQDAEIVAVHDAARPFAPPDLFTDVIARGGGGRRRSGPRGRRRRHGQAVSTGCGSSTPSTGNELGLAQTPQAFRVAALRAAHDAAPRPART